MIFSRKVTFKGSLCFWFDSFLSLKTTLPIKPLQISQEMLFETRLVRLVGIKTKEY